MPKEEKEQSQNGAFIQLKDKIDSKILEKRRIFIDDAIDNESASKVIRELWYLDLVEPGAPILIVINSPGGSVDSGFAIWDQVKMITSPVTTLVTGLAASMGSVLSLCASPKRRFATEKARIMIHQPMIAGVIKGQATDLEIQAKEMLKTRKALVDIYVQATGRDAETVDRAIDRDTWMTAEEALEFGLLDKIVKTYSDMK